METEIREIALKNIDLGDEYFRISFGAERPGLEESVRQTGIVEIPLLAKHGKKFRAVTGYSRLNILRRFGKEKQVCRIAGPGCEPAKLFLMNLYHQTACAPLNEMEKSVAVYKLRSYFGFSPDTILEKYACIIGIPRNRDILEKLPVLLSLEKDIQVSISRGVLSRDTGFFLSELDRENRILLFDILSRFKYSISNQKKFLEYLKEISLRDGRTFLSILGDEPAASVLNDSRSDFRAAGSKLMDWIRKMRFPALVKMEEQFKATLSKMKLPPGITVQPPKDFEGEDFNVRIQFNSADNLKRKLAALGSGRRLKLLSGFIELPD